MVSLIGWINNISFFQWRNRRGGGGQGGRVPPQRLLTGKFLLTYREKRGKKKREKGWKLRRKGGKLEMEAGKRQKKRWGLFFFFFFFFAFHFWKRRKFVLGLPKWEFSIGKKHFTPGKKIRKNDFAPSEKYACYAPAFFLTNQHTVLIGLSSWTKMSRLESMLYLINLSYVIMSLTSCQL